MTTTGTTIDTTGFRILDDAVVDCDKIIEWLEQESGWSRSLVNWNSDQIEDEIRTSSTAGVSFLSYRNPEFITAMNKAVYHAMDEYARDYQFSFAGVEDLSIQRYEPGQKYDEHMDYGYGNNRVLSAVLYLNTVEEGGETYFPYFDKKIVPVEGRLALFPSSFMWRHAALPPVNGMKYAAAFWAFG